MFKIVPNQKIITVSKAECSKEKLYAKINIEAMEEAAKKLESAGAFMLWIYFAKNQDKYSFALSSKAVQECFGMKIKQYNNAVATLIEKGYLQQVEKNKYIFHEIAVIPKGNNEG